MNIESVVFIPNDEDIEERNGFPYGGELKIQNMEFNLVKTIKIVGMDLLKMN